MSDASNTTQCNCDSFEFGDFVRSRQNPNLTGQVIGDRNWGSEVQVRLADGASTIWWHVIEIEHDLDAYPQDAVEDDDTNLVRVDFTKRVRMDESTITGGAA